MGKRFGRGMGCMRKFLILAFVIFSLAGYFTVSRVTTCQAQCTACNEPCIGIGFGQGALVNELALVDENVVQPDIQQVQSTLEVYFETLTTEFSQGMQPVMDWTIHEIGDWVNTFWYYNLLPEMQLMTKQLTTADVEQTFALGMFTDAANMIRARRTLDDMAIKDDREQRPSEQVCKAGTMISGMERANVFSDAYQAYGAGDKQWIAANTVGSTAATDFASYLNDRWENNGGKAQAMVGPGFGYLAGGYVPLWCNHFYNKGYAGCTQDGILAGQDIDVAGRIFGQDTIPLDPAQDPNKYNKGALDELVTNLAEAFGKDPVTAGLAGKDGILNSLSYRAKRQVVYDSLFYVISRRVPGGFRSESKSVGDNGQVQQPKDPEEFVSLLKEIRAATGEDPNTGCGLSASPCTTPDPSRNEIFRALIAQRFQGGQYALGQIDEPENNAREQVVDQALQLMQMNDQMELMDHYSLLLASQISGEIVQGTDLSSVSSGAPAQ